MQKQPSLFHSWGAAFPAVCLLGGLLCTQGVSVQAEGGHPDRPSTFPNARVLMVEFETDRATVQTLLPRPLAPGSESLGLAFIAHYPQTSFGSAYHEGAVFLLARHGALEGWHCLAMPVDDRKACGLGRVLLGYPKKMARITMHRDGGRITGTVHFRGRELFSISAVLDQEGVAANIFTGRPHLNLFPLPGRSELHGHDPATILLAITSTVKVHLCRSGHGALTLLRSDAYPLAEIPVRKIRSLRYVEQDIGGEGSSVQRIDLDASPPDDPARNVYDQPGPYKIITLAYPGLTDKGRGNRPVPIKIHFPDQEGPFPLIVFSHGGGGTWDAMLSQARHLVSHGYVALCVEHVYSNNRRLQEHFRKARGTGKARFMQALQEITTDPESVLGRPGDVRFAIDYAMLLNREPGPLSGRINTKAIAVAGHSYGAYTVLTVCGARPILDYLKPTVHPGKGLAEDLSDDRVSVGIAMSPQGPGTSRFGRDSYRTIHRPLLCLSGSKDVQLGYDGAEQSPQKRLEGFALMPPGDKYMLWLEHADHLAFADHPDGNPVFPSRARKDTQRICKAMMLVFLDAYLKKDAEADKLLVGRYVDSLCGDVVTKVTWYAK